MKEYNGDLPQEILQKTWTSAFWFRRFKITNWNEIQMTYITSSTNLKRLRNIFHVRMIDEKS